jgi:hypothetical protein
LNGLTPVGLLYRRGIALKKWGKNNFSLYIPCNCWCAFFKDPATAIDKLIVEIHCCREEINTRT